MKPIYVAVLTFLTACGPLGPSQVTPPGQDAGTGSGGGQVIPAPDAGPEPQPVVPCAGQEFCGGGPTMVVTFTWSVIDQSWPPPCGNRGAMTCHMVAQDLYVQRFEEIRASYEAFGCTVVEAADKTTASIACPNTCTSASQTCELPLGGGSVSQQWTSCPAPPRTEQGSCFWYPFNP